MQEAGYVEWRSYRNHRAMNLMGGLCLLAGVLGVGDSLLHLDLSAFIAGGIFLYAGGVGIPRLRRWATLGWLSNVSLFERVVGRLLCFFLAGLGALVVVLT
jgi:hypothetical protein